MSFFIILGVLLTIGFGGIAIIFKMGV